MPGIGTTIQRDGEIIDVWVEFCSKCVAGGTPDSWYEPGDPAEFEHTFDDANEDCGGKVLKPLTDTEVAQVEHWFLHTSDAQDRADQAAYDADVHKPEPFDDY